MEEEIFDYVVVGSGAGGGPVSCRLAMAGYRVLILEAGGTAEGFLYQVPAFHGLATEDPELSWDFFVRHYQDEAQQARDTKYVPDRKGILYPRAATLGGCTAHNAMITIYPHNSDWKLIADIQGIQVGNRIGCEATSNVSRIVVIVAPVRTAKILPGMGFRGG